MRKKTKQKTNGLSEPLVAIDFGSSGIVAMAAECTEDSPLHILGVEQTKRFDCVRHGIITSNSNAGFNIKELLTKLSNKIGYSVSLPSAFITIGGKSMQMAKIPARRNLGRKLSVSNAVLADMEKECVEKIQLSYKDRNLVVLSIEPYEYLLDGQLQYQKPTPDQKTVELEVHFVAFVGNEEILRQTEASFARSGVVVEEQWVRPVAHFNALASDEDQNLGCAILDLGDQTTTLSIFRNGYFVYSKVVPLGGYNITRDIQQQGISFENAQKIKHLYGCAMEKMLEKNQVLRIRSVEDPEKNIQMTTEFVAMIINSRLGEILNPLLEDLKRYTFDISKVYITGGGARLKGIVEYIKQYTTLPVVYGSHADWCDEQTDTEYYKPEYSALIGTLILADEFRKNGGQKVPGPIPTENWWERVKDRVLDMFEDGTAQ